MLAGAALSGCPSREVALRVSLLGHAAKNCGVMWTAGVELAQFRVLASILRIDFQTIERPGLTMRGHGGHNRISASGHSGDYAWRCSSSTFLACEVSFDVRMAEFVSRTRSLFMRPCYRRERGTGFCASHSAHYRRPMLIDATSNVTGVFAGGGIAAALIMAVQVEV